MGATLAHIPWGSDRLQLNSTRPLETGNVLFQFTPGFSTPPVYAGTGPHSCTHVTWQALVGLGVCYPCSRTWISGEPARTIYNTVPDIHWEPSKGSVEWLLWILLHLLSYIPWVLKVFILIITKIDSNPLTYYGWLWLNRVFMGEEKETETQIETQTQK